MGLKRQVRKSRNLAAAIGPIKSTTDVKKRHKEEDDGDAARGAAAEDVLTRGERTRQAGSGEIQFVEERKGGELTAPESRKPADTTRIGGGATVATGRGAEATEAHPFAPQGEAGGKGVRAGAGATVAVAEPPPSEPQSGAREGGRQAPIKPPVAGAGGTQPAESAFRGGAGDLSLSTAPAARQQGQPQQGAGTTAPAGGRFGLRRAPARPQTEEEADRARTEGAILALRR